jgi:hypothetical protein
MNESKEERIMERKNTKENKKGIMKETMNKRTQERKK